MNKKVVYTAITGEYDLLYKPTYINKNWDYICFTDNPNLTSNFWKIRQFNKLDFYLDPIKKARKYKILCCKYLNNYEESLWIDANFRIIGDLNEYIKKYSIEKDMLCLKHPDRKCIYKEVDACTTFKKDNPNTMNVQTQNYKQEGFPEDYGLIASGILYRKHTDSVMFVMKKWWNEVKKHSCRDQLSFNYICWKYGFEYDECDLHYVTHPFFEYHNHYLQ